jgi:hypothetical protein
MSGTTDDVAIKVSPHSEIFPPCAKAAQEVSKESCKLYSFCAEWQLERFESLAQTSQG